MRTDVKSTRFHERTKLMIPLCVYYRNDAANDWTENTRTEQITVCGIGFTLSRPVELYRLIRLSLPMPKKFRLFDYGKPQYEVWAVVCDVQMAQAETAGQIRLRIGTALIGEKPPQSFLNEPQTLYDLKPILRRQSFWDAREMPRRTGPYRRSPEERRTLEINLTLEIIDETGRVIESSDCQTLNVSESGMAVITILETEFPAYVLIKREDENVSLLAAVRSFHQLNSDNSMRLHLEFISGKWTF